MSATTRASLCSARVSPWLYAIAVLGAPLGHGQAAAAQVQSRWITVLRASNVTIRVDTNSKVRLEDSTWKVWAEYRWSRPQELTIGKQKRRYVSSKEHIIFDCPRRRFKVIATLEYDAGGDVANNDSWNEEVAPWKDPVPETVGEGLVDGFCGALKYIDGSFTAELAAYFSALATNDSIRQAGCAGSVDTLIVRLCHDIQRIPPVSAKRARARYDEALQALNLAFNIRPPTMPTP